MMWLNLESLEGLEKALERSHELPVVLFKHSTRCPTSSMAKRKLELEWEEYLSNVPAYFLDLIRFREISNEIEKKLGVTHESPQMILVDKGIVLYADSHHLINLQTASDKIK